MDASYILDYVLPRLFLLPVFWPSSVDVCWTGFTWYDIFNHYWGISSKSMLEFLIYRFPIGDKSDAKFG